MVRLAPINETAISMMAQTGMSPREIAEQTGLGYEAICDYLGLTQAQIRTVVWDIETTHLRADIGTLLMASFLDLSSGEITTHAISADSNMSVRDREAVLVRKVRDSYTDADILIGYNSLAFDKNFLNGVSARHGYSPLPQRFHIDCYLVARYGMKGLLQSNSLDNIADFLGVGIKDRPSKHDWREANLLDPDAMEAIRARCESDVSLTAVVWGRLRPYWFKWRGQ